MQLQVNTCKYIHNMVLHDVTCFTFYCMCYIQLLVLVITCQCMHYIHLHQLTCVTCFYMILHALSPTGGNDLQIDPPVPPLPEHLNHPPIPAQPAANPSGPVFADWQITLQAGPD